MMKLPQGSSRGRWPCIGGGKRALVNGVSSALVNGGVSCFWKGEVRVQVVIGLQPTSPTRSARYSLISSATISPSYFTGSVEPLGKKTRAGPLRGMAVITGAAEFQGSLWREHEGEVETVQHRGDGTDGCLEGPVSGPAIFRAVLAGWRSQPILPFDAVLSCEGRIGLCVNLCEDEVLMLGHFVREGGVLLHEVGVFGIWRGQGAGKRAAEPCQKRTVLLPLQQTYSCMCIIIDTHADRQAWGEVQAASQ